MKGRATNRFATTQLQLLLCCSVASPHKPFCARRAGRTILWEASKARQLAA
jgi:hypothetical protein